MDWKLNNKPQHARPGQEVNTVPPEEGGARAGRAMREPLFSGGSRAVRPGQEVAAFQKMKKT